MDERQRRFHRRVLEVGKIVHELGRQQHALVDEGLEGKAAEIPVLGPVEGGVADLGVPALADDVELALECHVVRQARVAADENLPDGRFAGLRRFAERGVVGRHGAPAEHRLPFGLDDLLEAFLEAPALRHVARQKHQAAGVLAGTRQRDAPLFADVREKVVRHLQQHAGPIPGVGFAAAGTAVIEVAEHPEALLQNLMGFAALHIHDEADAAGVMFEPRVIKTLLGREVGPPTARAVTSLVHCRHTGWRWPGGQRQIRIRW